MTTQRMLTGDRPTGRLHLGHYVGSLANRVRLQHRYETFLILADLHMLTTANRADDIARVTGNVREQVLDALAAGIDPARATFYLQSAIGEVAELNTLLQSLVTVPRLQRVPSLKEMSRAAGEAEMSYALLGYPVLQAADILCVKAHAVPVGQDNHAHVEVTREIARRFNHLYGDTFPVPELVRSDVTSLIGTDGRAKMSKSLDNAIYLSDSADDVRRKVAGMFTDPNRIRPDVPGRVEGNPVFEYHRAFNDDHAQVAELETRYREGRVGDVEVKQALAAALNRFLDPMRERRSHYEQQPGLVDEIVVTGTERTRQVVRQVVFEARKAMGLAGAYNRLRRSAERHARR
ncbi:tryptophanyl-tRNA synthetase [Saccharomonospora marina XMU15]|uniref:Tryptophan--tRNA ligase n=1 Tax=Saccharomonospora marina XMU15 TaxID=882083 RepID=H5XB48_9PSEU|nr:tryptophan--tRNA ligase [Saccharomonospora marina]EHR53778.1 tryptophanyl-tRNA synthetase [Saccharomonospora marina XMU15]